MFDEGIGPIGPLWQEKGVVLFLLDPAEFAEKIVEGAGGLVLLPFCPFMIGHRIDHGGDKRLPVIDHLGFPDDLPQNLGKNFPGPSQFSSSIPALLAKKLTMLTMRLVHFPYMLISAYIQKRGQSHSPVRRREFRRPGGIPGPSPSPGEWIRSLQKIPGCPDLRLGKIVSGVQDELFQGEEKRPDFSGGSVFAVKEGQGHGPLEGKARSSLALGNLHGPFEVLLRFSRIPHHTRALPPESPETGLLGPGSGPADEFEARFCRPSGPSTVSPGQVGLG